MPRSVVLVDGYNVLLALATRERVDPDTLDLADARARLSELLALWAGARSCELAIAWDGRRGLLRRADRVAMPLIAGVDTVFLEPPAEADDWIVKEAERLARELASRGGVASVVTRDRGLLKRLPDRVRTIELDVLANDLYALEQDPLTAPHAFGPGAGGDAPIPASTEPVDTSKLPRRRTRLTPRLDPPPLAPRAFRPANGRVTRTPAGRQNPAEELAEKERAAREEARHKRDERRARFERAKKRRP